MIIPNRIRLSKNATDKLRLLKMHTGITPNILSRCAISLAVKENNGIDNASVPDFDGLELNKTVLFGDYTEVFELLISQFQIDNDISIEGQQLIAALVEIGIHKIGHVRRLDELNQALI